MAGLLGGDDGVSGQIKDHDSVNIKNQSTPTLPSLTWCKPKLEIQNSALSLFPAFGQTLGGTLPTDKEHCSNWTGQGWPMEPV